VGGAFNMKLTKLFSSKGGQVGVGNVGVLLLSVAGAVILGAVVAIILAGIRSGQTANSLEYNITTSGLTFLTNVFNQFGTVGTIVGAAILLGAVALLGVGGAMAYQYAKNR